jgi:hypothetical protein
LLFNQLYQTNSRKISAFGAIFGEIRYDIKGDTFRLELKKMDTRLLSTYLQEKDNVMISPSFSLPDTVDSSKRIDYLARMKEEKK